MILDLDRHHPPWTYRLLSTWDAYRFNLAVSDRRVNENFYNLFFESGARNFRILLWGLCILPIPFFNWKGKINARYCYYYLIAGIIKIFNDLVYLKFTNDAIISSLNG